MPWLLCEDAGRFNRAVEASPVCHVAARGSMFEKFERAGIWAASWRENFEADPTTRIHLTFDLIIISAFMEKVDGVGANADWLNESCEELIRELLENNSPSTTEVEIDADRLNESCAELMKELLDNDSPLAEEVETDADWLDESCEELIRELLDDDSTFVVSNPVTDNGITNVHAATAKNLHSSAYTGPTISDIENALAATFQRNQSNTASLAEKVMQRIEENTETAKDCDRCRASLFEKIMQKIEQNTVTANNCEKGVPDDGYRWWKYGQKSIKERPNPRSYYRCAQPRCHAKKQVEKSTKDPEALIITYEGIHSHHAQSSFIPPTSIVGEGQAKEAFRRCY
ncbi:uncharacterized protein A4U43_C08F35410 [Asparagus officinalis]|nr:uncharacterized protein A4U43_C08F35410 [Asparagus officinalis]